MSSIKSILTDIQTLLLNQVDIFQTIYSGLNG